MDEELILDELVISCVEYNNILTNLSKQQYETLNEAKEFAENTGKYIKTLHSLRDNKTLLFELRYELSETLSLLEKHRHNQNISLYAPVLNILEDKIKELLFPIIKKNSHTLSEAKKDTEPDLANMTKQQRYQYYFQKSLDDMESKIIREGDKDLEKLAIEDATTYIYSQGQIKPKRNFKEPTDIIFEAVSKLREEQKEKAKQQLSAKEPKEKEKKVSEDEILNSKLKNVASHIIEKHQ